MVTERKFCRFSNRPGATPLRMAEVPEGGLCLSVFVVIIDIDNSNSALMGRLNPKAPWDHLGAIDASRAKTHSKGWTIPSSHLALYESPQDAAKRILKEQLEITKMDLSGPQVVSEVYTSTRNPDLPPHWDIEFIFKGKISKADMPKKASAWTELKFVDLNTTKRIEIARSHEDVLESAGLTFKSDH